MKVEITFSKDETGQTVYAVTTETAGEPRKSTKFHEIIRKADRYK